MELADAAMAGITLVGAGVLMVGVPLMVTANKKDDVSSQYVQAIVTEFVDNAAKKGQFAQQDYDNLLLSLNAATGEAYEVEIAVQVLDENPAKKQDSAHQTIGENVYYTKYHTQNMEDMNGNGGILSLKSGDILSVTAKRVSESIGEQLNPFDSSTSDTVSWSRMVSATGE